MFPSLRTTSCNWFSRGHFQHAILDLTGVDRSQINKLTNKHRWSNKQPYKFPTLSIYSSRTRDPERLRYCPKVTKQVCDHRLQEGMPESLSSSTHRLYQAVGVFFPLFTISKYMLIFYLNKHTCQEVENYWFQWDSASVFKKMYSLNKQTKKDTFRE